MKSNTDLLEWAESWHWPQLVLSERDKTCIQACEQNWRAWVARADQKDMLQAWQRIHLWNERAETAEEQSA